MSENTMPRTPTDNQPRKATTTIVIGGSSAGKIVEAGASSGEFDGSPDRYILTATKHNNEKRYFYLLESLRGESWKDQAIAVWEQGALATDIEAQPSPK